MEKVEELKQAWMNERFAPEILPFQEELISWFQEEIERQVHLLADVQGRGVNDGRKWLCPSTIYSFVI